MNCSLSCFWVIRKNAWIVHVAILSVFKLSLTISNQTLLLEFKIIVLVLLSGVVFVCLGLELLKRVKEILVFELRLWDRSFVS